ncbi:MAG: MFS transporter [Candidatus Methylacidiphilales bacterium]|nr:MFS transporter [Candidatus Methylacidiphilales bacterium]
MQLPAPQANPQQSDGLPEGIHHAYWFQVFNSASFSIVLGMPMVLYFKSLGASATVIGIVQGMPALLNILQIPSARYVERTGYRTFVLRGWTLRSFFIIGMIGVACLPSWVDAMTRVVLELLLLLGYNTSRGISACGWLPWITQLIPEKARGRYISIDQTFGVGAIVLTSILAGLYLAGHRGGHGFAVVFAVSFAAAIASLHFLKRIPDAPIPEEERSRSGEPVPWRAIWGYTPFRRIVMFNSVMMGGWACGGVLVVPFLRDTFQVSDSAFLYLNALWGVAYMGAVFFFGNKAGHVGNKPMLVVALCWQLVHFTSWGLIAARIIPYHWAVLALPQVTWALNLALFSLANTRLLMATVPVMGRSHFFALHSVVTSLVAGLMPFFWGMCIDAVGSWEAVTGDVHWNRFSLFYLVTLGVVALSSFYLARIEEPKSMPPDVFFNEFFIRTPARALSRIFQKRWMS